MKNATLRRLAWSDQGTSGIFTTATFTCWTLELPWRENKRGASCILPGVYTCRYQFSPALDVNRYRLLDVPDRSGILIHGGVWAGDDELDYRTHTGGCILIGAEIRYWQGQLALMKSQETLKELEKHFKHEPFELEIVTGMIP